MSLGARTHGFAELTWPGSAVAADVLTFTKVLVAGAAPSDTLVAIAAMLAIVFATDTGNAINDCFDRDTDRVNRPDHPIPHGAVTASEVRWLNVALFNGTVVSAFVLLVIATTIVVVNFIASLTYTEFFRGLPGVGNVIVAALTGSTFLPDGTTVDEPLDAAVFCVPTTLAALTREIIKNVEDIGGDREGRLRALSVVVGEATSLRLGAVILVVAVDTSVVPFIRGGFGLAYLGVVVPVDAFILVATTQSFGNPAAAQRRLKHGVFLAALAFILGRATTLAGNLS